MPSLRRSFGHRFLPSRLVLLASLAVATLALSAVALGATPIAGVFSGKTAQGKAISLTVESGGKMLRRVKVGLKARCPDGARVTGVSTFAGHWRISSGRISVITPDGTVKGTFTSSRKASGTLRMHPLTYGISGPQRCDSGNLKWSARHS